MTRRWFLALLSISCVLYGCHEKSAGWPSDGSFPTAADMQRIQSEEDAKWAVTKAQMDKDRAAYHKLHRPGRIVLTGMVGDSQGNPRQMYGARIRVTFTDANGEENQRTFDLEDKSGRFSIDIDDATDVKQFVTLDFTADGLDYTELKMPVPFHKSTSAQEDMPEDTIRGIMTIHVEQSELSFDRNTQI